MTSLRYAIPFIVRARSLGVDVSLTYDDKSAKYNSIERHRPTFDKIIEDFSIDCRHSRDVDSVDTSYVVECVYPEVRGKRTFSFQHGFDYTGLARGADASTSYVTTEESHSQRLDAMGVKSVTSPLPVTFWDWQSHEKKITEMGLTSPGVTLFYPEDGYRIQFLEVYDYVRRRGHSTYVKQRAKNQSIPSDIEKKFYDEIWYPSESIFLPMASDVSVGFGTSAYTDLVHLRNRPFIDVALPGYSQSYDKPTSDNFVTLLEKDLHVVGELICTVIDRRLTFEEKMIPPDTFDEVSSFLSTIL